MLSLPVSVRELQFKELPLYGVTEVIKSFGMEKLKTVFSDLLAFPKSVHGFILFLGQFTTTLVLCTIEAKLVSKLHIRCIRRYSRYLADTDIHG